MAPDLVQRRFNPEAPYQLWCGDITYIATDEGWLYLAAVIDLFSRQVVGWSLQSHLAEPAGLPQIACTARVRKAIPRIVGSAPAGPALPDDP